MRPEQRQRAPPRDRVPRALAIGPALTGRKLLRGSSVLPRSYSRSPSYSSKSGKRSPPSRSSRSRRSPSYSRYSPSRYHPHPGRIPPHPQLPEPYPFDLTFLYQYPKPCPSPNPAKVGTGILAILFVQSRVATRAQYALYSTILSHPGARFPCLTRRILLPLYSQPRLLPTLGPSDMVLLAH